MSVSRPNSSHVSPEPSQPPEPLASGSGEPSPSAQAVMGDRYVSDECLTPEAHQELVDFLLARFEEAFFTVSGLGNISPHHPQEEPHLQPQEQTAQEIISQGQPQTAETQPQAAQQTLIQVVQPLHVIQAACYIFGLCNNFAPSQDIINLIRKEPKVVHVRSGHGALLLHAVTTIKRPELIKCVTENGADINARHHNGNTALHIAVVRKSLRSINTLLAYGADPSIANKDGKTPLQLATERNFLLGINALNKT